MHFQVFDNTIPEAEARALLHELVSSMLAFTFRDSTRFDHMFMSAGETLFRLLDKFTPITGEGSEAILPKGPSTVLKAIETLPLEKLPLLCDTLDAALMVHAQYADTFPKKRTDPNQFVRFDDAVRNVMTALALTTDRLHPTPKGQLVLINHYILGPVAGRAHLADAHWHPETRKTLDAVCDHTWANAPDTVRERLTSPDDTRARTALGLLGSSWRYGHWLSNGEQTRALEPYHLTLAEAVWALLREEVNLDLRA